MRRRRKNRTGHVLWGSKEREEKGVIFKMNSGEVAGWIRDRKVMAAFLAKMGSTVDFKAHTYEVVMDWVPILFGAEEPAAWKRVEQSNGLAESAIQEAAWIKPTHCMLQANEQL